MARLKKFISLYYQYGKDKLVKVCEQNFKQMKLNRFKNKTLFTSLDCSYEDVQLIIDLLHEDLLKVNPHTTAKSFTTYSHSLSELEETALHFLTLITNNVYFISDGCVYNNLFEVSLDDFLYTDAINKGVNFKERLLTLGNNIIKIQGYSNSYFNRMSSKLIFCYVNVAKNIM